MEAGDSGEFPIQADHCSSDNEKAESSTISSDGQKLSKSQMKKLRKKEKWENVKSEKRKAEKERYKARKQACRERGEDTGPTRKLLRLNTMAKSSCKVHVVIDCDFDNYMEDKDVKALVKQIQFSYSANRRAKNPLQFYCCNVDGKCRERLESMGDYKGWDIRFHKASYSSLFEKSSLVYLSSESPNILERLDEDKVYIIGGLVDHNHHKGLCHKLAEEKGYAHAQLPIGDYIEMKTRKVLAINHVFEILLRFTESHDWQKAFYSVLPPRKGAVPKKLAETTSAGENTDVKSETENSDADDELVKDDQTGHLLDDLVDNEQEGTGNNAVDISSGNNGHLSKSADKANDVASTTNLDSENSKSVELLSNNKAELSMEVEAKGECD